MTKEERLKGYHAISKAVDYLSELVVLGLLNHEQTQRVAAVLREVEEHLSADQRLEIEERMSADQCTD